MHSALQLLEDFLSDRGTLDLPAKPRMIFVVRGSATIGTAMFGKGEVWHGEGPVTVQAGPMGVTLWRWELAFDGEAAPAVNHKGVLSREKLNARLDTMPEGELLWRGDSVAFAAGGVAYLHRHQGPGIRCVIEGELRVDTNGQAHTYGIGEAWFESGPEPVFAQAGSSPTRFIRVMILPRALIGKSSIQYVNEDDKTKPKLQQYRVFVDTPLTRPC
jgi:quercetin dioxygenase-like cupin family protein